MTALLVLGWVVAALAGAAFLELRRRLELVARAEHEIRGPLTAVVLGLESDGRAAALRSEAGRLRLSLEELRAARAGRRVPARVEAVELEAAVRASAASWEAPARLAGGEVSLDWRAGPAPMHADGRRVAQALGNVLANAVEHGGGRVRVSGRRTAAGVRVEVSDAGPGFAAAGAPDRAAGHGRGLAVASRAVREAGGRLRVESAPEGAIVALELPAAEPESTGRRWTQAES